MNYILHNKKKSRLEEGIKGFEPMCEVAVYWIFLYSDLSSQGVIEKSIHSCYIVYTSMQLSTYTGAGGSWLFLAYLVKKKIFAIFSKMLWTHSH